MADSYPLPADDDVAQAIEAKWNADPQLPTLVPGTLQRERASSFQPNKAPMVARAVPYGTLKIMAGRPAIHQTPGPGGVWTYVDYRKATIEVRGLEAQVRQVLGYIRSTRVFNRRALQTQAPFISCLQDETEDLPIDKDTKAGEDIWVGTLVFEVATNRNE